MTWLRRLWQWWRELRDACSNPWPDWDDEFPNSAPPADSDFGCPDTEPTSPGALDSDLGRLEP